MAPGTGQKEASGEVSSRGQVPRTMPPSPCGRRRSPPGRGISEMPLRWEARPPWASASSRRAKWEHVSPSPAGPSSPHAPPSRAAKTLSCSCTPFFIVVKST